MVLVTADPDEIDVASASLDQNQPSLRHFFIKLHAENNSDFATLSEVSSDAAILSVLLSCTELSETLY